MSQHRQVRVGMGLGVGCTALMGLVFLLGGRAGVWAVLALLGGLSFTIGVAAEITQKWEHFQHASAPPWQTGLRFVFTLLGACFFPWLLIGLLALIRTLFTHLI